jgi:hypothetical protein
MPMLRPGIAKPITVDVAEIPCLAGQDRLMAPGALVQADRDRGS